MTICPIQTRTSHRQRDVRTYCMLIPNLESFLTQVRLEKLQPATVYLVYMTAVYDDAYSNKSNNVSFTTISDSGVFRAGDACVVLIVIVMWIVAVVLFLQKWASIRIVQPRELRYKFKPKNLDNIKVVKRATDSVIYKSYSRQLSFTMEKREQKLERMNTLQSIQVEQDAKERVEREIRLKQMTKKERKEELESEKRRAAIAKDKLRETREKMREKEKEMDRKFKEQQKERENEREKLRLEREETLRSQNREKEKLKAQTSLPARMGSQEKEKLKVQMSLKMENIREKEISIPKDSYVFPRDTHVNKPSLEGNGSPHLTSVQIETAVPSRLSDSGKSGDLSITSVDLGKESLDSVDSGNKQSSSVGYEERLPDTVILDTKQNGSDVSGNDETVVVMMTTST
ncbi:zinc finger CCCH domain-containing protein 13-like isoform X2 [Lineus longissimus]